MSQGTRKVPPPPVPDGRRPRGGSSVLPRSNMNSGRFAASEIMMACGGGGNRIFDGISGTDRIMLEIPGGRCLDRFGRRPGSAGSKNRKAFNGGSPYEVAQSYGRYRGAVPGLFGGYATPDNQAVAAAAAEEKITVLNPLGTPADQAQTDGAETRYARGEDDPISSTTGSSAATTCSTKSRTGSRRTIPVTTTIFKRKGGDSTRRTRAVGGNGGEGRRHHHRPGPLKPVCAGSCRASITFETTMNILRADRSFRVL